MPLPKLQYVHFKVRLFKPKELLDKITEKLGFETWTEPVEDIPNPFQVIPLNQLV
jgi:hypothetical protein